MLYPKTHPWLPPLVSLCLFLFLTSLPAQAQITQDIDDIIGWCDSSQTSLPPLVSSESDKGLKNPPSVSPSLPATQSSPIMNDRYRGHQTRAHPSVGNCTTKQSPHPVEVVPRSNNS